MGATERNGGYKKIGGTYHRIRVLAVFVWDDERQRLWASIPKSSDIGWFTLEVKVSDDTHHSSTWDVDAPEAEALHEVMKT